VFQEWYYGDDNVRLYTAGVGVDGPARVEVGSEEFLRVGREWRGDGPPLAEEWMEYQVEDLDDDVDVEWRCCLGCRHADGCDCPSRRT